MRKARSGLESPCAGAKWVACFVRSGIMPRRETSGASCVSAAIARVSMRAFCVTITALGAVKGFVRTMCELVMLYNLFLTSKRPKLAVLFIAEEEHFLNDCSILGHWKEHQRLKNPKFL